METMSIKEFAQAMGICYGTALEIVHSQRRPPGFWAGRSYRISREGLAGWMAEQARYDKAPRR